MRNGTPKRKYGVNNNNNLQSLNDRIWDMIVNL